MLLKKIKSIVYEMTCRLIKQSKEYEQSKKNSIYGFDNTVKLNECEIIGNVEVGNNTYANKGTTFSGGIQSSVKIGSHCAIGRYVHITSKTHSFQLPTSDEKYFIHEHVEKDTVVGDCVWIGDHVFIKHGVTVGSYAIIGANSVVVNDVAAFEIVAGVPARHIRFNTEHRKYQP